MISLSELTVNCRVGPACTIRSHCTKSHMLVSKLRDIVKKKKVAQWDFQNKGRSRWTGTSCTVLEVPLRNLHTSMCDFVLLYVTASCKGLFPLHAF